MNGNGDEEVVSHLAAIAQDRHIAGRLELANLALRAPSVVVESGMTVDGWIPVDPLTLETSCPDVWAIGDVAVAGTPRAGVFA